MEALPGPSGPLNLVRTPFAGEPSHRAWDSADRWILEHAPPSSGPVLVMGENFGAMATAWGHRNLTAYHDSVSALAAVKVNRGLNPAVATGGLTLMTADRELPQSHFASAYVRLPRSLSLLDHYLRAAVAALPPDGELWLGGMAKRWVPGVKMLTSSLLGVGTPYPFVQKSRWIRFTGPFPAAPPAAPAPEWMWSDPPLTFTHRAGVFSREKLDPGTRKLLGYLKPALEGSPDKIVDLGCGNGILGIVAAASLPEAKVVMCDDSALATASARDNVRINSLEDQCSVLTVHGLEGVPAGTVDRVLCNPPFHFRNIQTRDVARFMFDESKRVLAADGELWVVANSHLGYHKDLEQEFGHCDRVDVDDRFAILRVRR